MKNLNLKKSLVALTSAALVSVFAVAIPSTANAAATCEKDYITVNGKFVDFEKCFDRLDRIFIWRKLLTEKVSSKLIIAIQAMYSVVKSVVRYKSTDSSFIDSNIGVKQGDPSSSLIFLFFCK